MITDAIINVIIAPIYYLFQLLSLPVVENIQIPQDAFNGIISCVSYASYLFPVRQCLFFLIFFEVLDHFTIVWALILRIKSFIPFMGGK